MSHRGSRSRGSGTGGDRTDRVCPRLLPTSVGCCDLPRNRSGALCQFQRDDRPTAVRSWHISTGDRGDGMHRIRPRTLCRRLRGSDSVVMHPRHLSAVVGWDRLYQSTPGHFVSEAGSASQSECSPARISPGSTAPDADAPIPATSLRRARRSHRWRALRGRINRGRVPPAACGQSRVPSSPSQPPLLPFRVRWGRISRIQVRRPALRPVPAVSCLARVRSPSSPVAAERSRMRLAQWMSRRRARSFRASGRRRRTDAMPCGVVPAP